MRPCATGKTSRRCCGHARGAFDDLALSKNGGKPIVGIVGEIYCRANHVLQ